MKILVVGDYIEDRYVFGTAVRLCPEAPVPVLIPQIRRISPGGAALVHAQLLEIGADAELKHGSWSFKERFFAGNHLICRVDNDSAGITPPIKFDPDEVDAFVVADYGKGAMTRELARQIVETGKPCFVDAKHCWDWYYGPKTWTFPNEHEWPIHHSGETTQHGYRESFTKVYDRVVQKLGAKGCKMGDLEIPATVTEVIDVTGAGDVFMAGFVYAWSIQLPAEDCLRFANALAGESCRHVGTFVVGREFAQSVLDTLRASRESQPQAPVSSPGSTTEGLSRLHLSGRLVRESNVQIFDTLPPRSWPDAEDFARDKSLIPPAQTLPESPSGPTQLSDAPTLAAQAIRDAIDEELGLTQQALSPTESERQCERTPAPDQDDSDLPF